MNHRPLRLLLALAVLPQCSAIESCRDQGRTPIVYVDIVDRASAEGGVDLPRTALEAGARDIMAAWPDFAFRQAKPTETGWQLDLRVNLATERTADPVGEAPPDPERVHRAVGVTLKLHGMGKPLDRAPSSVTAEALLTRDEARSLPISGLAQDAVKEAGQRLQRAMDLSWGEADAVVAALSAEAEWERGLAADAAGARGLREAVPALMAQVRDEAASPEVVVKSVGALVAIRDPQAADAIIDACRHREGPYVVQMIFALGALGGRAAEGYLFTVQSGHPDPALRDAAASALEELERGRAKAEPAAPQTPAPAP